MSSDKTPADIREADPIANSIKAMASFASAVGIGINKVKEWHTESLALSDHYKSQTDDFLEDRSKNGSTLEGMVARRVLSQRAEERNRASLVARTVSTKSELDDATKFGVREITVVGDLANDLHKTKKLAYVGASTVGLLTAALAAAPFTGGLSFVGAAPIAALTGLEIATIIAAASIGVALILAIFKDYEEIEYDNGRLVLKKKRS